MNRSLLRSYLLASMLAASTALAQMSGPPPAAPAPTPTTDAERHRFDVLERKLESLMWSEQVGDIAKIDTVRYTSKPNRTKNPTGQGAGNPLIIPAYTFVPKSLGTKKAPLIIFVHQGIHAQFDTMDAHIVRELLEQGYVIVAPDYRGSTGYGAGFYNQIDYGGTEIDDTYEGRNWAVENMPNVDPERVGIIGWSHGGYHALLNIFRWPDAYKVAYAGVPVSDLVQRMGYKTQSYRDTFASFIGKQASEDPMEYRRRSPVYHADKLATPLLIHANTNDEDVNVMEVEHLITALKAAGKKFDYKIYENAPGGHVFNRLDTRLAKESRQEIYTFLAGYLKPGT